MAENPLPWFRYYHETADDKKFVFLSIELGIPKYSIIGIWSILECRANQSPIRGSLYVTFQKRYSNIDVAVELNIDQKMCDRILKSFIEMDMLEILSDGAYRLKNWGKRQYLSDNSTDRVRKCRLKKQQLCNVSETLPSVSVSVSDSLILNEKKIKNKNKKNEPDLEELEIPEILNTPEFLSIWGEWEIYRKEIKKKMTNRTMKSQLKELAEVGPEVGEKMIRQSITNGWQGIFPLNKTKNPEVKKEDLGWNML